MEQCFTLIKSIVNGKLRRRAKPWWKEELKTSGKGIDSRSFFVFFKGRRGSQLGKYRNQKINQQKIEQALIVQIEEKNVSTTDSGKLN